MENHKEKEFFVMKMEWNMKENGRMGKDKEKEFVVMKMERNMKENGRMG